MTDRKDSSDDEVGPGGKKRSALDILQEFNPAFVRNLKYGGRNPGDLSFEEIDDLEREGRINDTTDEVAFQPHYGLTPLSRAMKQNDDDLFERVLSAKGFDINAPNDDNNKTTQLVMACEHFPDFIDKLLAIPDIDPNQGDRLGWTPLMVAMKYNVDKVPLLLAHPKIDIDAESQGGSAIVIAVQENLNDIIKALLEKGAKITVNVMINTIINNPEHLPLFAEHGGEIAFNILKQVGEQHKQVKKRIAEARSQLLKANLITNDEAEEMKNW